MPASTRILAICPVGIGNFLLLTPALQYLKACLPQSRITLLSLKAGISQIAGRYAFVDDIVALDVTKSRSPGYVLGFLKKLFRAYDISLAFFPTNRAEYNLVPWLARVKKRIGFRYATKATGALAFLNTDLVVPDEKKHDVLQNFRLLSCLGLSMPESVSLVPVPLTQAEEAAGSDFIHAHVPEGSMLIGVHPGSSSEHNMDKKRWPVEKFAELCAMISKRQNAFFFVLGGPEEEGIKQDLAARIGDRGVAVTTQSLFETASIIKQCAAFISNDSGLMHIAASYGVQSAGIFGPTDDTRTAPFGPGHVIIRGTHDCSPCWTIANVGRREQCRFADFRCLQQLSAEEVFRKIGPWL